MDTPDLFMENFKYLFIFIFTGIENIYQSYLKRTTNIFEQSRYFLYIINIYIEIEADNIKPSKQCHKIYVNIHIH